MDDDNFQSCLVCKSPRNSRPKSLEVRKNQVCFVQIPKNSQYWRFSGMIPPHRIYNSSHALVPNPTSICTFTTKITTYRFFMLRILLKKLLRNPQWEPNVTFETTPIDSMQLRGPYKLTQSQVKISPLNHHVKCRWSLLDLPGKFGNVKMARIFTFSLFVSLRMRKVTFEFVQTLAEIQPHSIFTSTILWE